MNDLLTDKNSKEHLETLKLTFKAHTVNGQIIAFIDRKHVVLGQIKEGKVFLNSKARKLLASIPQMSIPSVPVVTVTKVETVVQSTDDFGVDKKLTAARGRAPRRSPVQVPKYINDLSDLDDLLKD